MIKQNSERLGNLPEIKQLRNEGAKIQANYGVRLLQH